MQVIRHDNIGGDAGNGAQMRLDDLPQRREHNGNVRARVDASIDPYK